jgi:hypothetical protein
MRVVFPSVFSVFSAVNHKATKPQRIRNLKSEIRNQRSLRVLRALRGLSFSSAICAPSAVLPLPKSPTARKKDERKVAEAQRIRNRHILFILSCVPLSSCSLCLCGFSSLPPRSQGALRFLLHPCRNRKSKIPYPPPGPLPQQELLFLSSSLTVHYVHFMPSKKAQKGPVFAIAYFLHSPSNHPLLPSCPSCPSWFLFSLRVLCVLCGYPPPKSPHPVYPVGFSSFIFVLFMSFVVLFSLSALSACSAVPECAFLSSVVYCRGRDDPALAPWRKSC